MNLEIVTKADLLELKINLIEEIKMLLHKRSFAPPKPWLKNSEVKELLKISSNTIQRLRIAGKLKSSKVGGVHYYRYEDLVKLLEGGIKSTG